MTEHRQPQPSQRTASGLAVFLPGLLVAATGVGAGDLATAGFAGMQLGAAVLWAIAIGAVMKFVLTEGIARYQLAHGETLLTGTVQHIGRWAGIIFLIYLIPWTFFVGGALISACGATAHAMVNTITTVFTDPESGPVWGKAVFGSVHSAIGVAVVLAGGFKWFERLMAACVGVMFAAVVITAIRLGPDWGEVFSGLLVPRIPQFSGAGFTWTIGLIGGVGGTVTILCYGYWIREAGRVSPNDLRTCRIDLGVGYVTTALFGMAMLIIAAKLTKQDATGVGLIVALADQVGETLGASGRWLFLIGAWAAVFSSLLGVWQSVPFIFTDLLDHLRRPDGGASVSRVVDTSRWPYRITLLVLAVIPIVRTWTSFAEVQKAYTVMGAFFLPMLALVLIVLNGRRRGRTAPGELNTHRNRPWTVIALVLVIAFFAVAGWLQIQRALG